MASSFQVVALVVGMVLLVRKESVGREEVGRLRNKPSDGQLNGLVITLRRLSVEWETILTSSVLAFL